MSSPPLSEYPKVFISVGPRSAPLITWVWGAGGLSQCPGVGVSGGVQRPRPGRGSPGPLPAGVGPAAPRRCCGRCKPCQAPQKEPPRRYLGGQGLGQRPRALPGTPNPRLGSPLPVRPHKPSTGGREAWDNQNLQPVPSPPLHPKPLQRPPGPLLSVAAHGGDPGSPWNPSWLMSPRLARAKPKPE